MNDLLPLAETIAARLKARCETIAVTESSIEIEAGCAWVGVWGNDCDD
jgi:hypothetical protein